MKRIISVFGKILSFLAQAFAFGLQGGYLSGR
jgi:hypothetical protein